MLEFIFTEATMRMFAGFGADGLPDMGANVSDIGR